MSSHNRILILILLVALLARTAIVLCVAVPTGNAFFEPDSKEYVTLANNIVNLSAYTKGNEPEIFRAPGYPLFLAPLLLISSGGVAVAFLQALLGTGTCLLVYLLAQRIFPNKPVVALLATALQAIAICSIVASATLLSETLFTSFFILTLLLIEHALDAKNITSKKSIYYFIAAGICLALSSLTRAVILPFIPVILIYIIFQLHKLPFPKTPSRIISFLLPVILVVGGWTLRNINETGYKGFSSVASINLYRYNSCALLAQRNTRSFSDQQYICDIEIAKHKNQTEAATFCQREGIKNILSSPFTYSLLHLKGEIRKTLPAIGDLYKLLGFNIGGKGTLGVIETQGIFAGVKHYFSGKPQLFFIAIPALLLLLIQYLASGTAIATALFRWKKPVLIFYILAIIYFLAIPGPASHPRFRVPITPLISLFAAAGLALLSTKKTKKKLD